MNQGKWKKKKKQRIIHVPRIYKITVSGVEIMAYVPTFYLLWNNVVHITVYLP